MSLPVEESKLQETLVEWDFNLDVAAGCRGVHRVDHKINVTVHGGALRVAKDDNGNAAACEVLLIADVFVRR